RAESARIRRNGPWGRLVRPGAALSFSRLHEFPRRGESLVERGRRLPPERAPGTRRIENAAGKLAEPRWIEDDLRVDAARSLTAFGELEDGRLDPRADVVDPRRAGGGGQRRCHDVRREDVVPRLAPVPEDVQLLAVRDAAKE